MAAVLGINCTIQVRTNVEGRSAWATVEGVQGVETCRGQSELVFELADDASEWFVEKLRSAYKSRSLICLWLGSGPQEDPESRGRAVSYFVAEFSDETRQVKLSGGL